jgi:outer membrane protein assembly factor BamA
VLELKKKGYAEANIDSAHMETESVSAFLHIGYKYTWAQLTLDSVPFEVSSSFHNKIRNIEDSPFNAKESRKIGEDIVSYYEDNGYPFARVEYDSILIENQKVNEKITLIKGPLIIIDSISLKGFNKTNPQVIYQLIGIKPNSIYSEKKIRQISTNLSNVKYIDVIRPQEFYFTENKNILFIYLKEQKTNNFSGILGFQNNPNNDKLMLTGDLSLGLNNVFKQGEWILFNWNKFQNSSQKLYLNIGFPYLFKSPIGIGGVLNLLKQDTTYIDVTLGGKLIFSMNNNSRFEFSISSRKSNSLSSTPVNTPLIANISLLNYKLSIRHRLYDYYQNPRKGYAAYAAFTISNKNITNQTEGDTLYTNPIQYQIRIRANYFIPTFSKQTLALFLKGGAIFNKVVFLNEMFNLGGLSSIRGFNDLSINASQYAIGSVEYRYLYEKNTNIRLFTDIGLIKNQEIETDFRLYIGFGVGASIETKAGIFNLSYAMGKKENEILQLSNTKVHISYINVF